MNGILLVISVVVAVTSSFCSAESDDELLAVAVYFRHGDRSPKKSFPTDEFFDLDHFPMGVGQLTNKGLYRQYELGQWLRQRYSAFLPEVYSSKDILVRSTDVDRTLMSAAANLAGLYPPEGDQIWNTNLLWRPIPIHTVPETDDDILAMEKPCRKLKKKYKEQKKAEFYKQINEAHADLYEYVAEHSGENITDISDIKTIRSVFYVYKNYNASFIPTWADSLNQTVLDYLSALTYARYTATEKLKRLRSGPFLYHLIDYFENVTNGVEDTPKFMMFSSHDTELVSILDAMAVYDLYPPNFAATIIWEVRRDEEGSYYINLFYKKTETELLELTIPNCEFNCNLDVFKSILEPVTASPEAWVEECDNRDSDDADDEI